MKRVSFDEWKAWRDSGIGSSEAPIIMEASPWCTPLELFLRRTGRLEPQPQTFVMRRGLKLEPIARQKYQELTGIEVPARCLESETWSVARGSFDGLNEEAELAIEVKCPGREDHGLALKGGIPEKYVWQLVHLIFVSGYKSIDYVSYNPNFPQQHQLARVVFYRDEKMEQELLAKERHFWKCLQDDVPPGEQPRLQRAASTKIDPFKIRRRGFLPPR